MEWDWVSNNQYTNIVSFFNTCLGKFSDFMFQTPLPLLLLNLIFSCLKVREDTPKGPFTVRLMFLSLFENSHDLWSLPYMWHFLQLLKDLRDVSVSRDWGGGWGLCVKEGCVYMYVFSHLLWDYLPVIVKECTFHPRLVPHPSVYYRWISEGNLPPGVPVNPSPHLKDRLYQADGVLFQRLLQSDFDEEVRDVGVRVSKTWRLLHYV